MSDPKPPIPSETARRLREAGVPAGARVLVAVSGGADSVALLHALDRLDLSLAVAHFDHQTRAGGSAEDARFVQALAAALGLPCFMGGAPVQALAKETGESFEQAARRLRYAFLLDTARREQYPYLATGHQRDDQAETVLLRLIRGASPAGLCGIPLVREEAGIQIVRPLLHLARAELQAWALDEGYGYREDMSNANMQHLRNRVRHRLLPLLRDQFNPEIEQGLLRLAESARAEQDLLEEMTRAAAEQTLHGNRVLHAPFRALPLALQRRVLLHWAWRHGFTSNFDQLERVREFVLEGPAGARLDWASGWRLYRARGHAQLLAPAVETDIPDTCVALPVPGSVRFAQRIFRAQVLAEPPGEGLRIWCTPSRQVFDAASAGASLELRTRRDADRFQPLGMRGTRKLSDYFIDLGMPAPDRDRTPLLVSEHGILWVVGHAMSALAAVGPNTECCLVVEVEDETE